MIVKAWLEERVFNFKHTAKTSRNVLTEKTSHFIFLENEEGKVGVGECSPIYGLSPENEFELRAKISEVIYGLNHHKNPEEFELQKFPSIKFALECAHLDMLSGGTRKIFNTDFSNSRNSLIINGLIWMDDITGMMKQVEKKITDGFKCIKLKIGSQNFQDEVSLLSQIRREYGDDLEIRLDANGAFSEDIALHNLSVLAEFNIHSIEQPIKPGNWDAMAKICATSNIPIALDEELIGIEEKDFKHLISTINPSYLILKPSLLGGFTTCDNWIKLAEDNGIGWWATSMLESNIGLNDIAQWVSQNNLILPQGLGTGMIYSNNIHSPLVLNGEELSIDKKIKWDLTTIS